VLHSPYLCCLLTVAAVCELNKLCESVVDFVLQVCVDEQESPMIQAYVHMCIYLHI